MKIKKIILKGLSRLKRRNENISLFDLSIKAFKANVLNKKKQGKSNHHINIVLPDLLYY